MKDFLKKIIQESLRKIPLNDPAPLIIEKTTDEKHGDFTTNIALLLASLKKEKPRNMATLIFNNIIIDNDIIKKIEIAGPGFINFFLTEKCWYKKLIEVESSPETYGESSAGQGEKILLEFVSANPTGPMHVGHGRGAAVGDVLANLFKKSGHAIEKEYYINDLGNQITLLGRSTYIRYQQLLGNNLPFPETGGYQGEYIFNIAREIINTSGNIYKNKNETECLQVFIDFSKTIMLNRIKNDLKKFGITFDTWVSEKELHQKGEINKSIDLLKAKKLIYELDDALWLRSAQFGDEKDRVIRKGNGEYTYFASDISYHKNKFDRGFTKIIDIWGADHHGYIPRIESIIKAMDYPIEKFKVILVQLVNLKRGDKEVSMSKRSGEFITLSEVIDEVGKDVCRFFFLMRSADSHLDFDLELAKKESKENPVYYIQYAFARINSVFRLAKETNIILPPSDEIELALLNLKEEMTLIKQIAYFPDLIAESAQSMEPHRLIYYLQELAGIFHTYYNKNRIISEESQLTLARLFLMKCLKTVLENGLNILGVSTPEKM